MHLVSTSIILFCVNLVRGNLELLILHHNDINGRIAESHENGKTIGGMARISHLVKEARKAAAEKRGPPVLYLNAGDYYVSPVWRHPFARKVCLEFTNVVKPDVACFGCHDLDYGLDHIRPFMKRAKYPLVAANIKFSNDTHLNEIVKPYVVLSIQNVKIGIIGYITARNHLLHQQTDVILEDEVAAVQRESIKLKDEGVSIVIALGHSGIDVDRKIAREVDNVDVVIGGLTNTFLWNGQAPHVETPRGPYPLVVTRKLGSEVLVATTYGFTKYLGRLKVTFNKKNEVQSYEGNPVFLDSAVKQDPEVLRLLGTYGPAIRSVDNEDEVIGRSFVLLSTERIRKRESNFANFVGDSLVEYTALRYTRTEGWTDTPIAMVNAGSVRKDVRTSKKNYNITRKMLNEALPFRQRIVAVTLPGAALIETLENAVRAAGLTRGGEFLQVSGLRVLFDFAQLPGERVKQVRVYCDFCSYPRFQYVNPNKHYNILVNTYLATGGDGHVTFKRDGMLVKPIGEYAVDILEEILAMNERVRPEEDGRLAFLNEIPTPRSIDLSTSHPKCRLELLLVLPVLYTSFYSYIIDILLVLK